MPGTEEEKNIKKIAVRNKIKGNIKKISARKRRWNEYKKGWKSGMKE